MLPSALLVIFNMWILVLILMQTSVGFSNVSLMQICVAFSSIICFGTMS